MFNYTNIRVVLNKDSFIEDEIIMKNAIETEYPVPSETDLDYLENQYYEKIEYDGLITEPKLHWDLDRYREYSFSTWFRYVRRADKLDQLIFRLTSNEPDSGEVAHGHNVLSLYQTDTIEYLFKTYTVENQDKFSNIVESVKINQESQQLWTYVYYGYNNEDLQFYIEWPDSTATKQFKGWHVVAKYWALQSQDSKYTFQGKTAYSNLRFGKGSWGVYTEFDEYKIGKNKFWPGVQMKTYDAKWITHTQESEYDSLLHEESEWVTDEIYKLKQDINKYINRLISRSLQISDKENFNSNFYFMTNFFKFECLQYYQGFNQEKKSQIFFFQCVYLLLSFLFKIIRVAQLLINFFSNNIYEYGFGMWTKFFITNPSRIYEKPDRILIARLGFSDNDQAEFGVYIGRGDYEFWAGSMRPVQYGKNLDGYWNYIYFSYSKLQQISVGYVNFNKLQQIQRTKFDPFDADPANNYARFYVGNWKNSQFGFNGRMASAVVRMGRGSFICEIEEFQTWMELYKVPVDEELGTKDHEIQGADNKDTETYETFIYEHQATETEQYSVYGWFKYYGDLSTIDFNNIYLKLNIIFFLSTFDNNLGYQGKKSAQKKIFIIFNLEIIIILTQQSFFPIFYLFFFFFIYYFSINSPVSFINYYISSSSFNDVSFL